MELITFVATFSREKEGDPVLAQLGLGRLEEGETFTGLIYIRPDMVSSVASSPTEGKCVITLLDGMVWELDEEAVMVGEMINAAIREKEDKK